MNGGTRARELARLGLGLVLALAYFIAPMLLIATLSLGILLWTATEYFYGYVLGIGFLFAMPIWLAAHQLQRMHDRAWFGSIVFLLAGAIAAILAFGMLGVFEAGQFTPFDSLGAGGADGVVILVASAGISSSLGWLTMRWGARERGYDDALDGLDFAQITELARSRTRQP